MKTHKITIRLERDHVLTFCGLIRHKWNALNITTMDNTVDCKRCLKKMNQTKEEER